VQWALVQRFASWGVATLQLEAEGWPGCCCISPCHAWILCAFRSCSVAQIRKWSDSLQLSPTVWGLQFCNGGWGHHQWTYEVDSERSAAGCCWVHLWWPRWSTSFHSFILSLGRGARHTTSLPPKTTRDFGGETAKLYLVFFDIELRTAEIVYKIFK